MQLSLLEPRERFTRIRKLSGPQWWERYDALPEAERPSDCRIVPCPHCEAPRGSRCRRPSGHSGPAVGAHAARWDLALAEAEARYYGKEG